MWRLQITLERKDVVPYVLVIAASIESNLSSNQRRIFIVNLINYFSQQTASNSHLHESAVLNEPRIFHMSWKWWPNFGDVQMHKNVIESWKLWLNFDQNISVWKYVRLVWYEHDISIWKDDISMKQKKRCWKSKGRWWCHQMNWIEGKYSQY
jgi:hypothetical protein